MADQFKVKAYVKHGYYEYEVGDMGQALAHAEAIMSNGTYRHAVPGGVEVHRCYKVKVVGPGMESEYGDTFKRT